MITWLSPDDPPERFPPHEAALHDPPGLLAAGGDLKVERLVAAYQRGIFPWYSPGQPVLWWSPDPREVLLPQEFHLSRRFARSRRAREFEWRSDRDFAAVVAACAAPRARSPGTWITTEMASAYCRLHQRGLAHSYETWRADRLVGGLYGVRLGRVFFGESMFSRERDASKAALAGLVQRSAELGIELIDCQLPSAHLRSLGSRAMPRAQFLRFLQPA
ncbi:MAG TPA: leucyl/phenylalanyl-tRNA--protein transferase [Steroidobacteraceae bacterium]|jgi:leucyl/phenylalanyl-tRNA--protein transferase